jgi:hypothetical protein
MLCLRHLRGLHHEFLWHISKVEEKRPSSVRCLLTASKSSSAWKGFDSACPGIRSASASLVVSAANALAVST